ncbi:MAG TPA: MoaD/ThiS family protein [Planctomycetota bacterium]|nr:MoaD/ThiS family protein [Planctomycetota bacterium]
MERDPRPEVVVAFPAVLRRHVDCPPMAARGRTVREAVDDAFARRPDLRGYLLDDQGGLRRHVALFVDGRQVRDRTGLADPVQAGARLEFFQALSGG